ncbi:putative phage protein, partial [human gut metagenome]
MYRKQFTVEDLKQADMSVLDTLNELYLEALGGKKEKSDEESEGDEKKEQ